MNTNSYQISGHGLLLMGFRCDETAGHPIFVREARCDVPGVHIALRLLPGPACYQKGCYSVEIANWHDDDDEDERPQLCGLERPVRTYEDVRRVMRVVADAWLDETPAERSH